MTLRSPDEKNFQILRGDSLLSQAKTFSIVTERARKEFHRLIVSLAQALIEIDIAITKKPQETTLTINELLFMETFCPKMV